MTTIDVSSEPSVQVPDTGTVDFKLEVVVLPVSDVDRAKQFYTSLGWREDADFSIREDFRVVQMTPPGSPASIIFGTGVTAAEPGPPRPSCSPSTTSTRPAPSCSLAASTCPRSSTARAVSTAPAPRRA